MTSAAYQAGEDRRVLESLRRVRAEKLHSQQVDMKQERQARRAAEVGKIEEVASIVGDAVPSSHAVRRHPLDYFPLPTVVNLPAAGTVKLDSELKYGPTLASCCRSCSFCLSSVDSRLLLAISCRLLTVVCCAVQAGRQDAPAGCGWVFAPVCAASGQARSNSHASNHQATHPSGLCISVAPTRAITIAIA